jgi:hypothetical protein
VLIGGLIGVVILLGVVAAVLLLRRSHDDVHSVEHYHRQLHTLEEIRTHTPGDRPNGNVGEAFPATAFRVSGSSTVRLTESDQPPVPPVPPPPVPQTGELVTFDDANPEPVPPTFMTGNDDRVIQSINRRPRRLGGPAIAIAAVLVLIAVLIFTGLHSNGAKHHGKSSAAATTTPTHPATGTQHATTTTTASTTTTVPPAVSAPTAASAHAATYTVAASSYSLNLAATTGECWVDVTDAATGSVLFTMTLPSGQAHAITATGPVTVIAGAPGSFGATVNGAPVTLPPGNAAPFTLHFLTAPATATG